MNREKRRHGGRKGASRGTSAGRASRRGRQRVTLILLIIVFAVGVGLLLYPTVSNYWNSFHQSRAVMSYSAKVADMSKTDYSRILRNAKKYNRQITKHGINWNLSKKEKAAYERQLNVGEDGSMGYIDIPKISVQLPIYHGTNEAVLQTSIGHLEGTSLPIGGKGTHSVLSGHRGLPSAKLFTDLDQLREGDTFTIHVLNRTLTYEVDQIRIVEPTDLSDLKIVKGKDYCTLLTCTPYGINTHRLLVRGHRVKNLNGNASILADAIQIQPIYVIPFVAVPIIIVLVIYVFAVTGRRRRKHRGKTKSEGPEL
ncbi:class C sortase [Clostridium sp. SY8519]|uniref:class C sortase n=1 Tax=Clostridium sp. (strain SY8519) TaxID=1042156 RepID=UPI00031F34B1|nr:class C sortase [Clostridium sp. SY8519]